MLYEYWCYESELMIAQHLTSSMLSKCHNVRVLQGGCKRSHCPCCIPPHPNISLAPLPAYIALPHRLGRSHPTPSASPLPLTCPPSFVSSPVCAPLPFAPRPPSSVPPCTLTPPSPPPHCLPPPPFTLPPPPFHTDSSLPCLPTPSPVTDDAHLVPGDARCPADGI